MSVTAIVLVLSLATGNATAQRPAQLSGPRSAELTLTLAEEKDSYEIYSILLRKEMSPAWDITGWAIT
jgi:hypothetical protein